MYNKDVTMLKGLDNKDITIIARDCVGGILYHQLGLRFLSPTINLFFVPEDFNYFCLHLKEYISTELIELKDSDDSYPIGVLYPKEPKLKPLKVHFLHYNSFIEAKEKWIERKNRINWNNIYVISTFCYPKEVATFSKELVDNWNKIKFKKVVLVDKKYGFDNEFIINKPSECQDYAWLLFANDKDDPEKRVFNEFDFVNFLNS